MQTYTYGEFTATVEVLGAVETTYVSYPAMVALHKVRVEHSGGDFYECTAHGSIAAYNDGEDSSREVARVVLHELLSAGNSADEFAAMAGYEEGEVAVSEAIEKGDERAKAVELAIHFGTLYMDELFAIEEQLRAEAE